jgi:hypothetical protein
VSTLGLGMGRSGLVWTNTSRDGLEGSAEGEMGCGAMYRCSGTNQSPLPVQWFGFGLS